MHGSNVRSPKCILGYIGWKIIKEYSSPFSPQVSEHRATIDTLDILKESAASKSVLSFLQQHMDYMLHHILLPFTGLSPAATGKDAPDSGSIAGKNDCTKRAWENKFQSKLTSWPPSHK